MSRQKRNKQGAQQEGCLSECDCGLQHSSAPHLSQQSMLRLFARRWLLAKQRNMWSTADRLYHTMAVPLLPFGPAFTKHRATSTETRATDLGSVQSWMRLTVL